MLSFAVKEQRKFNTFNSIKKGWNKIPMQKKINLVKSVSPFAVGAVLDVAGRVQKVVERDGQYKLIIEPGNSLRFVVFADCTLDAETVKARKIRKGSLVSVRGKLQTYGAMAVCLRDCKLVLPCHIK